MKNAQSVSTFERINPVFDSTYHHGIQQKEAHGHDVHYSNNNLARGETYSNTSVGRGEAPRKECC